jgi:hypothetical protein
MDKKHPKTSYSQYKGDQSSVSLCMTGKYALTSHYLANCKLKLAGLLIDSLVHGFSPVDERFLQKCVPIEVEAIKGKQADLHLYVCHFHVLALARAQYLHRWADTLTDLTTLLP